MGGDFCFAVIGRAEIEGSEINVARNASLQQTNSLFANFPHTSFLKLPSSKLSIGHAFVVCICRLIIIKRGFACFVYAMFPSSLRSSWDICVTL